MQTNTRSSSLFGTIRFEYTVHQLSILLFNYQRHFARLSTFSTCIFQNINFTAACCCKRFHEPSCYRLSTTNNSRAFYESVLLQLCVWTCWQWKSLCALGAKAIRDINYAVYTSFLDLTRKCAAATGSDGWDSQRGMEANWAAITYFFGVLRVQTISSCRQWLPWAEISHKSGMTLTKTAVSQKSQECLTPH